MRQYLRRKLTLVTSLGALAIVAAVPAQAITGANQTETDTQTSA